MSPKQDTGTAPAAAEAAASSSAAAAASSSASAAANSNAAAGSSAPAASSSAAPAPQPVPAPKPAPAPRRAAPRPGPGARRKRLAPAVTAGQANALRSAKQYLAMTAFSHAGLIEQLSSSYGEGFSVADATYAADHVGADWNQQAAKAAKQLPRDVGLLARRAGPAIVVRPTATSTRSRRRSTG